MSPRLRSTALALVLAPLAACAGGAAPATNATPSPSAAESTLRDSPPRFISSTERLEIGRVEVVAVNQRTGARTRQQASPAAPLTLEVMVDANGVADVGTLKLTGGLEQDRERNQEAIVRWLRAARFTPAMKDGQPVAAIYRQRLGR